MGRPGQLGGVEARLVSFFAWCGSIAKIKCVLYQATSRLGAANNTVVSSTANAYLACGTPGNLHVP